MEQGENLFAAARKAARKTQDDAAAICDLSVGTYCGRERDPLRFRLRELIALRNSYSDGAKLILKQAIDSLFLS